MNRMLSIALALLLAVALLGPAAAQSGGKPLRLGVQHATIHDRYATASFKGIEPVRYGKQDEVFLGLVAGRIDAALAAILADGSPRCNNDRDFGFDVMPAWARKK